MTWTEPDTLTALSIAVSDYSSGFHLDADNEFDDKTEVEIARARGIIEACDRIEELIAAAKKGVTLTELLNTPHGPRTEWD